MKDSSDTPAVASESDRHSHALLRALMMWSYERGTLQYDIICALILAFIFIVPRSCFAPKKAAPPETRAAQQTQPDTGRPAVQTGAKNP